MPQFGFFFDQSRCYNCHACAVACRAWYNIDEPTVKWMRVCRWEKGAFPNVELHSLAIPCYHCEDAPCVKACPYESIYKEDKYGAVIIDEERCAASECTHRPCFEACLYGSIQFMNDDSRASVAPASKCTMCIDRLEQDLLPLCVAACPSRAFDFGPMEEMEKKYGKNREIEGLPDSRIAKPSVVFKPRRQKKSLVPYDSFRALQLLAKREGLPQVFNDTQDVTEIPESMAVPNRLILKPRTREELLRTTRNDE